MPEKIVPYFEAFKQISEQLKTRIDLEKIDNLLPDLDDTEMSLLADILSPRVKRNK